MIKVDAIGKTCPIPIIMTKNALKDIEEGQVEVSVDNKVSLENLEKMSREMGYNYDTEINDDIFKIVINKTQGATIIENITDNTVVVIDSLSMGKGDTELGTTLMNGFIYTLTEMEILPKTILFYNEGVKHAIIGSKSLDDLLTLESRGVEIMSCGACLNYYNLTDKVRTGSITNMYTIIERQMKATRVIKP